MTPQQEHSSLVKSGMFWEFFPELTGLWDNDKSVFTAFCKQRSTMKKFKVGDKVHVDYLQQVGANEIENKSIIGVIVEMSNDSGFAIVRHKAIDQSGEIVFTAIRTEDLY